MEHNCKTLLWGHRRWCRCVSLSSHLRTPCTLHIQLCCRCILLGTHRPGGRWIWLRGHRLRSRCIKLHLGRRRKEIWMHAIPSSRIPSFWKHGCRPILHRCSNRRGSRIDRICCSYRRCSSSLWWYLTVTHSCLAILSRQSYCHRQFQGNILYLIWLYIARTHAPWKHALAKVLTTALCTVLPMTVALLMKACATAWPTASIILFSH